MSTFSCYFPGFTQDLVFLIELYAMNPSDIPGSLARMYPIEDGYHNEGDALYEPTDQKVAWWDYGCSALTRGMPKTLNQLVSALAPRDDTWKLFQNPWIGLNLIECSCWCCHGAQPVVRFYSIPKLSILRWRKMPEEFRTLRHHQIGDWLRARGTISSRHICKRNPDASLHWFYIRRINPIEQSRVYCISSVPVNYTH